MNFEINLLLQRIIIEEWELKTPKDVKAPTHNYPQNGQNHRYRNISGNSCLI